MSKIKAESESLTEETPLTGRPLRILRMLHEEGSRASVFTLEVKQRELAAQLGISRQALNVHLRKLRDNHYIRTGRGFIDITENGLHALGTSISPAFVFLKISPLKRKQAYEQIFRFPIQRVFRVTGEMDVILVIDRDKLEAALSMLGNVEGVLDTRTYIAIQTLK